MTPINEKEALAYIEKLVNRVMPKVNIKSENLLRFGVIRSINASNHTASVEIVGSGQSVPNAIYPSSFVLVVGQRVLIGTPDPKIGSQNYILSDSATSSGTTGATGTTGEVTLEGSETLTNKTLISPVINTGISGTAIAVGSDVTTGTNNTLIVTPKSIGDAGVNTRLKSKLLTSTRAGTGVNGDVSYTGIGFVPTSITAYTNVSTGVWWSVGFCDSNKTSSCIYQYAANLTNSGSNLCSYTDQSNWAQSAIVKSFDADGFTLTWTKAGTPTTNTMNLIFICYR